MRYNLVKLPIIQSDLVLEVGSGDDPYHESDVIVDKYLSTSFHREAQLPLTIDKRLILADALYLPFGDKVFDFVIASHILEHVDNPKKFLDELTRVAKKGYIETPGILRERVFNWPFHKWYVDIRKGKITLTKKTARSHNKKSTILSPLDFELLTFFEGSELLNYGLIWKDRVDHKIITKENESFLLSLDRDLQAILKKHQSKQFVLLLLRLLRKIFLASLILPEIRERLKRTLIRTIRKQSSKKAKKPDLNKLLVCPKCKQSMVKEKNGYRCASCKKFYPKTKEGIFNFIISE